MHPRRETASTTSGELAEWFPNGAMALVTDATPQVGVFSLRKNILPSPMRISLFARRSPEKPSRGIARARQNSPEEMVQSSFSGAGGFLFGVARQFLPIVGLEPQPDVCRNLDFPLEQEAGAAVQWRFSGDDSSDQLLRQAATPSKFGDRQWVRPQLLLEHPTRMNGIIGTNWLADTVIRPT